MPGPIFFPERPATPAPVSTPMQTTRRTLVKGLAFTGLNLLLPGGLYAQNGPRRLSPNEKIRVACIGVGGRGRSLVDAMAGEELVAFCDVDDAVAGDTFKKWPDVPRFKDYREMFEKLGDKIDAVTVCGPDHVHFLHAMEAVKHGKHVYVEKPLCQTIAQTRELHAAAKQAGVKTQMGNQGHSLDGPRHLKEWVQAGLVGPLVAVDSWTNRPSGMWPQGRAELPPAMDVPAHLDWDLWRNGIDVPYHTDFVPFKWRGWTMFGTGALGDMACHILSPFWFAFEPGLPDWVECEGEGGSPYSFPATSVVRYHFPARDGRPEFIMSFWSGREVRPPAPRNLGPGINYEDNGTVFYGSRETVMADTYGAKAAIIPAIRAEELKGSLPAATLPRIKDQNHYANWLDAIRGNVEEASSHFAYSAGLNELVLLGVIAQRIPGKRLDYDAAAGKFTNDETANRLISEVVL